MYFYYEQEIPIYTLEANPVILPVHTAVGLLDFIDIGFPEGVNRLAKARIYYNQFQLVPFNRDMWITGNGITLRIPIKVDMEANLSDLEIYCINLDDSYPHALSFGVSIDIAGLTSIKDLASLQGLLNISNEGE